MKRVRLTDQWAVLHADCRIRVRFVNTYTTKASADYRRAFCQNPDNPNFGTNCRVVRIERWAVVPERRKKR